MHNLLEWIRRDKGDAPPGGLIDAADVVSELEETPLGEGYEPVSKSPYYGSDWDEIRQQVIAENNGTCLLCGSFDNLHVHHIEPIDEFDTPDEANTDDNLVPLCGRCHSRIEVIQIPGKRRTVDHFVEELHAEGVSDVREVIEGITNRPLQTNDFETCSEGGCFYPVKDGEEFCPSCGEPEWPDITAITFVCQDCGTEEVANQHGTPDQFGCGENEDGIHHYERRS